MKFGFRPPLWRIALTLALSALMISAGFWQLRRAEEKRALVAHFERIRQRPPQDFSVDLPAPSGLEPMPVRARGRYLADRQLWLDNQVSHGVAGYRVWTPLQLDKGGVVLVDRGWIIGGDSREHLPQAPVADGSVVVEGYWRELPRAAISVDNRLCGEGATRVVQYPTHEALRCLFEAPLANGLLLLSPAAKHGYRREWSLVEVPPERHLSYALQWFAFTATLLALFVGLNLKRQP